MGTEKRIKHFGTRSYGNQNNQQEDGVLVTFEAGYSPLSTCSQFIYLILQQMGIDSLFASFMFFHPLETALNSHSPSLLKLMRQKKSLLAQKNLPRALI